MREQQPIPLDTGCIFMLIILNEKLPLTGSWHIRRLGVFLRFFKWDYLSIGWVLNYEDEIFCPVFLAFFA